MGFWVGWQLWQKLSLVLAALITIVLIYAFCVLAYTRWERKKFAAADALQKEEEAVLYPMLTSDDIPFGARALESGVQVEGIWISNPNSPIPSPGQPGTPVGSPASSPALKPLPVSSANPVSTVSTPVLDSATTTRTSVPSPNTRVSSELELPPAYGTSTLQRPGVIHNPGAALTDSDTNGIARRTNGRWSDGGKRAGFRSRIFLSTQHPNIKTIGRGEHYEQSDVEPGLATGDLGVRVSPERARGPRTGRLLRRRSSEEFRRKMSQIFNDSIPMNPPPLQLPVRREEQRRSKRKSLLGQFRASLVQE